MQTAYEHDLGHLGVPDPLRDITSVPRVPETGFAPPIWLDLALASDSPSTPTGS